MFSTELQCLKKDNKKVMILRQIYETGTSLVISESGVELNEIYWVQKYMRKTLVTLGSFHKDHCITELCCFWKLQYFNTTDPI